MGGGVCCCGGRVPEDAVMVRRLRCSTRWLYQLVIRTEVSPVLGKVENVNTGDSLLQPWELRDLNMCRYV